MGTHSHRAPYLAATLTFEDDQITWVHNGKVYEVMMQWEQPIMEKMAELTVSAGDKVLECGFGMGILSNAIQARNPGHHTIVECHPEVLVKARAWAADKSNVTIVEGDWFDLKDVPGRFNAILMDTYADGNLHPGFAWFCTQKAEDNCKVSWWNYSGGTDSNFMKFNWDDVTFTEVTGLNPPENTYYNRDNYFVPLKIVNKPKSTYGILLDSTTVKLGSETISLRKVRKTSELITCADPSNPSLVAERCADTSVMFKCKGVYSINNGLLKITGNNNMIVKRDGSWVDKKMNELIVGDKLYKIDNTEVEITSIDFDNSNTVYEMAKINIAHNYFVNDILIKKGEDHA
tara:strand:+ start:5596 stop:6633 length:1038 start_codon:yes stop_codon:yes gene_type:complete